MTDDNTALATPGEAGPKTRRIRYFGSPFSCDGYGAEARAAISCLRRTGYDLTLVRSGRD